MGDKELENEEDPYWWNQSASSKNLMNTIDAGLWDELFQEKSSSTDLPDYSIEIEYKCEEKECAKMFPSKQNEASSEKLEEQLEPLSLYVGTKKPNSMASQNSAQPLPSDTKVKPFPSQTRENLVHSTRESNSNSISESHSIVSDMTVHLDYARLKAEHRKLRKYFENAFENRYKAPPIDAAIKRLNNDEPIPFDFYKSYHEKMELLDAALEHCDWDGIITVLLFIKRTLSNSLFRRCLIEKPKAAQHYIAYLREANDPSELIDSLFGLGQTAEALMVEFVVASKFSDPQRQMEALKNCLSGFSHPELSNERRYIEEWVNLLKAHLIKKS